MDTKVAAEDKITVYVRWNDQPPETIECFRVSLNTEGLVTKSNDGNERIIPYKDCNTLQVYPSSAVQSPGLYKPMGIDEIQVSVRWFDGYFEGFKCSEVRFGSDLLWMRLMNGQNRHVPLRQVRWFSVTPESHENVTKVD